MQEVEFMFPGTQLVMEIPRCVADLIEQQARDKRYLTNSEKNLAEGLSLKTSELLDAQARIAELEAEVARLKAENRRLMTNAWDGGASLVFGKDK